MSLSSDTSQSTPRFALYPVTGETRGGNANIYLQDQIFDRQLRTAVVRTC